eukprot:3876889-Amphidinium_carterae.1
MFAQRSQRCESCWRRVTDTNASAAAFVCDGNIKRQMMMTVWCKLITSKIRWYDSIPRTVHFQVFGSSRVTFVGRGEHTSRFARLLHKSNLAHKVCKFWVLVMERYFMSTSRLAPLPPDEVGARQAARAAQHGVP